MNSNVAIPRNVIIYGLCVPLALLMGYLLTTPLDFTSLAGVGLVMMLLLVPIFLKWHHFFVLVTWNASLNAFFLPGQPRMWMLLGVVSVAFSILDRVMNKEKRLQNVWWLTLPMICLLTVILVTAYFRGGIGLRTFGSASYGGKKYMEPIFAIVGFFALSWQKIPPHKALLYCSLFFLSGLTSAISNLAYSLKIYWLFWLFPVDVAVLQIQADYGVSDRSFLRLSGVAFACMAPFCFLLLRHGVRGIFQFSDGWGLLPIRLKETFYVNQPYRILLFVSAIAVSTFGGFRSMPILFGMIFAIQFCIEKLYQTKLFYVILGAGLLGAATLVPFTSKLPLVVQRAICFLPVKVNPVVRYDAWASTDWRLRMWSVLMEEVPHYVWLGKGYAVNPVDLYLARESQKRGFISDFETASIAGDYHSGPLSVLIPLGVFGLIAFIWFLVAGIYAVYRNHRYGLPEYQKLNTFLFAFYLAQVIFYFAVFGAFSSGLYVLTGTVAFSLSLNGGVAEAVRRVTESATAPLRKKETETGITGAEGVGAPA